MKKLSDSDMFFVWAKPPKVSSGRSIELGAQSVMVISRESFADFLPTLICFFALALATLLFGGSETIASLAISTVILSLAAILVWGYPDLFPKPVIIAFLFMWAVLWVLHTGLGYTDGHGEDYLMLLSAIAIFWFGKIGAGGHAKPHRIWRLFLILGLIYSLFAFFQFARSPDQIFGMDRPYHQGRLGGSFLSSNTAATFFGIIVIAAAAHTYRSWKLADSKSRSDSSILMIEFIQRSALGIITFLFSLTCLLLTASRSGVGVTLIALGLFFVWTILNKARSKERLNWRRIGPEFFLVLLAGAVIFVIWSFSGDEVTRRYGRLMTDLQSRKDMLSASWATFQYKPILGYGLGHLNEAKLLGVDPINNFNVMKQDASHNFYVQTLVQTGIVGLVAIILSYLYVVLSILRGAFRKQPYSSYLIAIICISVLVAVHGLFDFSLEVPAVMLLHVWLLGLGYGIQSRYR